MLFFALFRSSDSAVVPVRWTNMFFCFDLSWISLSSDWSTAGCDVGAAVSWWLLWKSGARWKFLILSDDSDLDRFVSNWVLLPPMRIYPLRFAILFAGIGFYVLYQKTVLYKKLKTKQKKIKISPFIHIYMCLGYCFCEYSAVRWNTALFYNTEKAKVSSKWPLIWRNPF